jgi:multiple sugar transport system ATP-binding protein
LASVRLKDVQKIYDGGVVAVQDFNLEIQDKEFVVLVGPSGCGKSTTLRMIAGLEEVSIGQIFIDERLVNDVPPKDRDIAMVFQNYALYPHMTVYENMAFGLKLRKFRKDEINKRVLEAATILGMEEYLARKPKELSGGQRQRVAVGRAIVRKPKVFLFDEPLSNLDAKMRVQMRTEISKLHQRLNATMIYVTHDQTEAMTMADRIVLMKDGHIQQIDSPLNIYNRPNNIFVAGFIGSPAMNLFEGVIEKKKELRFREKGADSSWAMQKKDQKKLASYVGKEVILGIRPENITHRTPLDILSQRVTVKVSVIEPMGNEVYVYFNTVSENNQYIARIPAYNGPKVGKSIDLLFDMMRVHFFDAKTQNVL